MSKICTKCGKNKIPEEETQIQINGINFTINPNMFCFSCSKEELIGKIDCLFKREKQWYTVENDEIVVDWKKIEKLEEKYKDCAYEILLAMGVLSFSDKNNWIILGPGSISLNPRCTFIVYFVNKKHAIAFAQALLSRTLFNWETRQG
ncbi:MAG: hypothetical protein KAS01_03140 [Candidatus Pacebacteria bacterium]|nr:hypothetical protein [Candidatus Paceibacterota bacterium]